MFLNFFTPLSYQPCSDALIAGQGLMPRLVLKGMAEQGSKPLVLCLDPANFELLKSDAGAIYLLSPLELQKAVRLLSKHGSREITIAGRVPHQILLTIKPWHLSWQVLKLWLQLPDTRANTVLGSIVNFFDQNGFKVISSLKYLSRHILFGASVNPEDKEVLLGVAVAKTLGALDVGQSVVVYKGSVIAVEGIEGTDGCLDRVMAMGIRGAILVKMPKPNQDLRFDVPMIGDTTFKRLIKGGFKALVVQEGMTICPEGANQQALKEAGIELIIINEKLVEKACQMYSKTL